MQADAQGLQQRLVAGDGAGLPVSVISPACARLFQLARQAAGAADPEYGLQIAQAAWTFLEIGFEVVIGIDEAGMAFSCSCTLAR